MSGTGLPFVDHHFPERTLHKQWSSGVACSFDSVQGLVFLLKGKPQVVFVASDKSVSKQKFIIWRTYIGHRGCDSVTVVS